MRTGQMTTEHPVPYKPAPFKLAHRIRGIARTGQGGMLPAGRYWIDLFGSVEYRACLKQCFEQSKLLGPAFYYTCKAKCYITPGGANDGIDAFNAWGNANNTSVKTIKSEEFNELEASAGGNFQPPRTWVLFELVNPVEWPDVLRKKIGLPTVAGPEVNTSDDTVQKPPPEKGPLEEGGFFDQAKPWLIGGGALIGLALVVSLVRR